jgi:hypothetical protein
VAALSAPAVLRPRASLRAAETAETAEFFSFGTNDLTQTAFGISRDDAASFLGTYMARGILASDPFVSIDREGVGELVRIGVERGRKTKARLKVTSPGPSRTHTSMATKPLCRGSARWLFRALGELIPIGLQMINAPAKGAPRGISGQIRRNISGNSVHCSKTVTFFSCLSSDRPSAPAMLSRHRAA